MVKKIDYAALFSRREKDGRYIGHWTDSEGKRHTTSDRDPERLYKRLQEKTSVSQPETPTFLEAAEKWKDKRFENLSYKSVEAYKPVFRRLTARFGPAELDAVQTRNVAAFLQSLASENYSKRTVQLHRDMMSQIYNAAIADGLTRYNPCDHVEMPKGLSAGTRGIPSDEVIEAVKGGIDQPFGLFAYLCLYAGLRRGEALALRYEDIDRTAKRIHVTKSVVFVSNNPHLKEPKTKNGRRDVILLDVLDRAIPQGSGYIFANESGGLLSKEGYASRWDRYCRKIGCKLTAHQLRHAYATTLYEAGIPDKDAQEQLGHANITLTRDVYTHISKRQKSKTAVMLNKFVDDESKPKEEPDDIDAIVEKIFDLLEGRDAGEILARLAVKLADKR